MLSSELLIAASLCHAYVLVEPNVCQHSAGRISGEVMWVVQEARKELQVYEGLKKADKAQKVTINMAVCDADCLPSAQRLLWVKTCGLV